jgi:AraC-like DNA-binding protein
LIHLFTEQIGIPLRRYVLWLRLMTAVQFAVQGESLTEAAHRAGFSDSAHLCRTFRRMYGITLSGLVKNSQFVQVISCFP